MPVGSSLDGMPADLRARNMMSLQLVCRGKRPQQKRQWRQCLPLRSTLVSQCLHWYGRTISQLSRNPMANLSSSAVSNKSRLLEGIVSRNS
ncbi:unnamed protein product [Gordionus sp. m RMFG-2023]